MELRQLRYFVRIVELSSMSRAALELQLAQSAMSQQINRLENELSTRLLKRTTRGVTPTEAGLAFFREAQLVLRHAEQARRVAQRAHLSGTVSVGLAPTTVSVLGMPLMRAMHERYPDVRLHIVESLSGHLASMLDARQLDLAVLFDVQATCRWNVTPLLEETLFLMRSRRSVAGSVPARLCVAQLEDEPLIVPTGQHGLRRTIDAAFARAGIAPKVIGEIDSLALLMDAVDLALGSTIQPWAATGRFPDSAVRFHLAEIADPRVRRTNALCCLAQDELSPVALAARIVLIDCVTALAHDGKWPGAKLLDRM
jgi:LysR family tcuABC transcriptional regulator